MAFNPNSETNYQSSESSVEPKEQVDPESQQVESFALQAKKGNAEPTSEELKEIDLLRGQIIAQSKEGAKLDSGTTVAEASAFTAGAMLGTNFEMLPAEHKAALVSVASTETQNFAQGIGGGMAGEEGADLPPIENSAGNWIRNNPEQVESSLKGRETEMNRLQTLRDQVRDELKQKSFFTRLRMVGLSSEEEWVNAEALKLLNKEKQ